MQEKQELTKSDLEDNFSLLKTKETNDEVLEQIFSLTLITPNDLKKFEESKEFLLSTYTDVPQYRPLLVKLVSVLNDTSFPTYDAKYWQCKAEAEVHYNEFNRELIKYKKGLIDIAEIDYKIKVLEKKLNELEKDTDPILVEFDLKRLFNKKEEYMFEMKQLEKKLKYRMEEMTDWAKISANLEEHCEFSTKVHAEHFSKSFIKSLESRINKSSDEKEKKMLNDQLNTFKRMVTEKA